MREVKCRLGVCGDAGERAVQARTDGSPMSSAAGAAECRRCRRDTAGVAVHTVAAPRRAQGGRCYPRSVTCHDAQR